MVDEGWTTVEKKAPKEAGTGGRGGGPSGGKDRARGSGATASPRVPRNFPHRRHERPPGKETLEAAAIDFLQQVGSLGWEKGDREAIKETEVLTHKDVELKWLAAVLPTLDKGIFLEE